MKHFDVVKFATCESANKRRIQLYADVFYHDEVEYFMSEYTYAPLYSTPSALEMVFRTEIMKGSYRVPCGSPVSRAREKSGITNLY